MQLRGKLGEGRPQHTPRISRKVGVCRKTAGTCKHAEQQTPEVAQARTPSSMTPAEETRMLVHLFEEDVARYGGDPDRARQCVFQDLRRGTSPHSYLFKFAVAGLTITNTGSFRCVCTRPVLKHWFAADRAALRLAADVVDLCCRSRWQLVAFVLYAEDADRWPRPDELSHLETWNPAGVRVYGKDTIKVTLLSRATQARLCGGLAVRPPLSPVTPATSAFLDHPMVGLSPCFRVTRCADQASSALVCCLLARQAGLALHGARCSMSSGVVDGGPVRLSSSRVRHVKTEHELAGGREHRRN